MAPSSQAHQHDKESTPARDAAQHKTKKAAVKRAERRQAQNRDFEDAVKDRQEDEETAREDAEAAAADLGD